MTKTSLSNPGDALVNVWNRVLSMLPIFMLLTVSSSASAAETEEGGILAGLLLALLLAVTIAVLVIAGIVYWSRKQEHAGEMTLFCLKYLVHSLDESERCASAKALGKANDAGALLVLLDVSLDEQEPAAVRRAAAEALHDMGENVRKFKKTIDELEVEKEQDNLPGLVGVLTAHFEQGEKVYAQSAYVIGRLHMLMALYGDAREWFAKAEVRNRRSKLYGNRIENWVAECNTRMLEEADDSYKSGDYLAAKEHYAVLDHGLSDEERRRGAVYLREACVYCKLEDYRLADQSLLQALDHNQEPELALTLAPMLQEIVSLDSRAASSRFQELKSAIDKRVDEIMKTLQARTF